TKQRINDYFTKSQITITENNWKQAFVPEGAIVVDNENGTAPGVIMEENGKTVILLPGPPNELIPMFMNDIYPYLNKLQPETIYSKMVKVCGVGESTAETMIKDLIDNQTNPTVAPYAKVGEVHIRVTARAKDEEEAKKMIKPVVKELKARFGKNVYSTDENETLEEAVSKLPEKKERKGTTAEDRNAGMNEG
ncbi:competence/damage-inducible protein A, partial [Lachnotalea glycerini]